jgi:hypothetical protein
VAARALVCHLAVTNYGLSLTATASALTISNQSVLRGVTAGQTLLTTAGWKLADLLPR